MKCSVALAGAMLMVGSVSACGGGAASTQEYCDSLQQLRDDFSSIQNPGPGDMEQFNEAIDRMSELADQAPDEVSEQWQTLSGGLEQLRSAVDDLGISMEDLADPQAMSEIDPQQLQEFQQRVESLGSQETQRATDEIEQHAQQECGIDLGGGGGGGGGS